jgi:transcription termination factor NusB
LGVEYLYDAAPDLDRKTAGTSTLLSIDTLGVLPLEWLKQFNRAISHLDQAQMLALVEAIPPDQADLIPALTQAVNNFDYQRLLNITEALLRA